MFVNCVRHTVKQWTSVSNAGGATVSSEVETELVEWLNKVGLLEVVHNHAATRSK